MSIIQDMLNANAHFGHQTNRWNPKMSPYIFASRNGLHIIDLRKTAILMNRAMNFIVNLTSKGGKILFIATKKQAKNIILKDCSKTNSFFVHNRWLGGMLTNFNTIRESIKKMNNLEESFQKGLLNKLPKKEIFFLSKKLEKLKKNLLGVKNMINLPDAIFVVDPNYENIAIKEAHRLNIPIIAVTDTNCNPNFIDYIIPANDDSMKSIEFFVSKAIQSCIDGEEQLRKINKEE